MRALESRVGRLESLSAAQGNNLTRLVLLTYRHGPTAEQQGQAIEARDQGREVFIIRIVAASTKSRAL